MIEKILRRWLEVQLAPVPVLMERPPDGLPATAILIERTGTGFRDRTKSVTLAFQSYAPSLQEAAELNERLMDAVDASIALVEISKVDLNSAYNFTDTVSKRYRYQAVYDIAYY